MKHLLNEFLAVENHSVSEIERVLKETEQLTRVLSAYRFLVDHKEISNDINVHLKIMDAVSKQEEAKAEIKETVKHIEPIAKSEPISTPTEKKAVEIITKQEVTDHSINVSPLKKIEFGLNDKYRVINELFNHSTAEYTTAINQLNMTISWEDAENYLDSLKSVYSWKSELPLVKTLYAMTQKRFQ